MKWMLMLIPVLVLLLMLSGCSGKDIDPNLVQGNDIDIEIEGGREEWTDPDAPKTIQSKEITEFKYELNCQSLTHRGHRVPYEYCAFSLSRQADAALCRVLGELGSYDDSFMHEFKVPLSALDDLQALAETHNFPAYNGMRNKTIGIPERLGAFLWVEYASGEYINAYDNAFDILGSKANEALYDFFRSLARDAGKDFLHTTKEVEDFQKHIAGTWKNEAETVTVELRDDTVKIYDGTKLTVDTTYYREYDEIYSEQDESGYFGRYARLEWRDGWIIAVAEDGTETELALHRE